jgi:RNA polymerase sigma-70 factor (ECF subfamily)
VAPSSPGAPGSPREELSRVLAEQHEAFVSFVARRVRDRATAEDLVHAVFERALEHLGEVRDGEAVLAWFYRALRNAVVDHHRKLGTEDRALAAWAAEVETIAEAQELAAPRVCPCVKRVAASLKVEYADALQRIEVDGVAVKEFAVEQGISSSNAAVRVFRAREALRRGLVATCGACAAGGCTDCTCGT